MLFTKELRYWCRFDSDSALEQSLRSTPILKCHPLCLCVSHVSCVPCACVRACVRACIQTVCLCGLISVSLCVPSPSPSSCQSRRRPSASCPRWASSSWRWPSSSSTSTRSCASRGWAGCHAWSSLAAGRKAGRECARGWVSSSKAASPDGKNFHFAFFWIYFAIIAPKCAWPRATTPLHSSRLFAVFDAFPFHSFSTTRLHSASFIFHINGVPPHQGKAT